MLKIPCENDKQPVRYRVYAGKNAKSYLCIIATAKGPQRAVAVAKSIWRLERTAYALRDCGFLTK